MAKNRFSLLGMILCLTMLCIVFAVFKSFPAIALGVGLKLLLFGPTLGVITIACQFSRQWTRTLGVVVFGALLGWGLSPAYNISWASPPTALAWFWVDFHTVGIYSPTTAAVFAFLDRMASPKPLP